ncbi:MAG: hypothetical protein OXC55_08940 [Chloroflexi bacterium]|nr:hypothetical protein [Chloroflexota bacterium]
MIGVIGAAAAVGQIGGRRLPLVVADLLKYWLGPRRFEGEAGDLLQPAPVMAVEAEPGLMDKMWEKGRRRLRRLCNRRDRRNGDGTGRNHNSSSRGKGKGSKRSKKDKQSGRINFGRRRWVNVGTIVVLAVAAVIPQAVLAQGEGDEGGYHISEVDLELPPPVLGRRVYVEEINVTGGRLNATVRAATDISLRARAYGGDSGDTLRFADATSVDEGETASFDMPLDGNRPSFTFSWVDSLGQAGAFSLNSDQLPHPLPFADGELCDAEVTSLSLSRSAVSGTVATDCAKAVMEILEIETVSGKETVEVRTVKEADVARVSGKVTVRLAGQETNVPLVADGVTTFSLSADPAEGINPVSIDLGLRGSLRIPMPPLVEMRTVPERTVQQAHVVSVLRPGISRMVRETVTGICTDGTEESHRISAYLSVPSTVIDTTTRVPVTHEPYVTAAIVEREPVMRWRDETIVLESLLWADALYAVLEVPEPEPTPEAAEQVPADSGVVEDLFDRLGWDWPW